jgi:hypothetical protein
VVDDWTRDAHELAAQGRYPVAHSWGDDRPGTATALFAANVEEAYRTGTLFVTYRREQGAAGSVAKASG